MGSIQFGGSDRDAGSNDSSKSSLKSFKEELLSADRTSAEPAITVPTHECQVQNLGMYPHSSTCFVVYIKELTLFSFFDIIQLIALYRIPNHLLRRLKKNCYLQTGLHQSLVKLKLVIFSILMQFLKIILKVLEI
jgi:hypothetical protein